jgi:hypothetical protein
MEKESIRIDAMKRLSGLGSFRELFEAYFGFLFMKKTAARTIKTIP